MEREALGRAAAEVLDALEERYGENLEIEAYGIVLSVKKSDDNSGMVYSKFGPEGASKTLLLGMLELVQHDLASHSREG